MPWARWSGLAHIRPRQRLAAWRDLADVAGVVPLTRRTVAAVSARASDFAARSRATRARAARSAARLATQSSQDPQGANLARRLAAPCVERIVDARGSSKSRLGRAPAHRLARAVGPRVGVDPPRRQRFARGAWPVAPGNANSVADAASTSSNHSSAMSIRRITGAVTSAAQPVT